MMAINQQSSNGSNTKEAGEPQPKKRLQSLDAYRGLVMLLLAFTVPNWGWQIPIIEANPDASWLHKVLNQTEHVAWHGISFWDMIQPSFMFMVGVSMAYSYSSRQKRGDTFAQLFRHAAVRAIMLVLLGIFLRSLDSTETNWTLEDVVSQIGLGYVPLFLVWSRGKRIQLIAAVIILIFSWALYAAWPLPSLNYDWRANQAIEHFTCFWAHWNQNANPGHYLDQWLLNLLPRSKPFIANGEGYNTLNFVPSLAVMIFGLMAGEKFRENRSVYKNLIGIVSWGIFLLLLGLFLDSIGICPLVKKIWTSSFSLVSSGICLLTLGTLYYVIDILGWKKWAYPAVVVGLNPLAMYCMTWMIASWVLTTLKIHLGGNLFDIAGSSNSLLLENFATGSVLWMICYWMHRRNIYLRL